MYVGLGTAVGIYLAAFPLIEKVAQPIESVEGLTARLEAAVAISLAGAGALEASNSLKNRYLRHISLSKPSPPFNS